MGSGREAKQESKASLAEPARSKEASKSIIFDEDCLAIFTGDDSEDEDNANGNDISSSGRPASERPSVLSPEQEAKEKREKTARQRSRVEKEIVASERSYVRSLNTLIEQFIHPLKAKGIVDVQDMLQLFQNIELLYGFHGVFLIDLQKKDKQIHVTFERMADFLKMYTQYINGYDLAMETINKLSKKSKFRKFLQATQTSVGQSLMSFLIMPVQRIPRYVLLLKELIKHTQPGDLQLEPLQRSLDKVTDIAAYVNEQKRQMESRATLLHIAHKLSNVGSFELFKPNRHHVKQGTLYSFHHKMTRRRDHQFMLFTDVVLWASTGYTLESTADLMHLKLDEISVTFKDQQYYGFRLHVPDTEKRFSTVFKKGKPPTFFAQDAATQKEWCAAIRETVSEYVERNTARRQRRIDATSRAMKQRREIRCKSLPPSRMSEGSEPDDLAAYANLRTLKLDELKKLQQQMKSSSRNPSEAMSKTSFNDDSKASSASASHLSPQQSTFALEPEQDDFDSDEAAD